jgi:acetylornithine deacetylase
MLRMLRHHRYDALPMPALNDRELLTRLVAHPTVCGRSNTDLVDFIAGCLEPAGVVVDRRDGPEPGRVNLVARVGPEPTGDAGLTLSGHLDVVPADEPDWTSDPFTLTERDGMLFGRGSCDMKGFIAVAVNAAIAAAERGSLRAPLCLVLTCDEELGAVGAQRLVRDWDDPRPLPRATVIGEPTSLQVVRMHKGHLKLRIIVEGVAAHSGSPHLGDNAVERAGAILAALTTWRAELAADRPANHEHFPAVPFTVLNIARVRGGHSINVIPDRCEIELGLRLLPGQAPDAFREKVRTLAEAAGGRVELINDNPPMAVPADASVHRALCGLVGQDKSLGVSFASDGGPLRKLGLEPVLFGPGSIEDAHRPDEFVPIAELTRCRETIDLLVREMCG